MFEGSLFEWSWGDPQEEGRGSPTELSAFETQAVSNKYQQPQMKGTWATYHLGESKKETPVSVIYPPTVGPPTHNHKPLSPQPAKDKEERNCYPEWIVPAATLTLCPAQCCRLVVRMNGEQRLLSHKWRQQKHHFPGTLLKSAYETDEICSILEVWLWNPPPRKIKGYYCFQNMLSCYSKSVPISCLYLTPL